MRPTGLGHGVYKDVPDYSILCGERCIGRIYETAADPPICAGSRLRAPGGRETLSTSYRDNARDPQGRGRGELEAVGGDRGISP